VALTQHALFESRIAPDPERERPVEGERQAERFLNAVTSIVAGAPSTWMAHLS
jgi:hypothetical protein